jgi:Ni,Fe-hydrogenase I cytochrome b subunit
MVEVNNSQLLAYLIVVVLSVVVSLVGLIIYRNTDAHGHFKENIKLMTYNYLKAEDFKS